MRAWWRTLPAWRSRAHHAMFAAATVAHSIYGVPFCINTANYVYFLAMEKCTNLQCPEATKVFLEEMLNLHRGQGWDIMWREHGTCPTEEQYRQMVLDSALLAHNPACAPPAHNPPTCSVTYPCVVWCGSWAGLL